MKIPKIKRFFKVQVNYKSGISKTFVCSEFEVQNRNLLWKSHGIHRPLDIAFYSSDNIESIWQIGSSFRIVWE